MNRSETVELITATAKALDLQDDANAVRERMGQIANKKSPEYLALRAKLDLISEDQGRSHTATFNGGVWSEKSLPLRDEAQAKARAVRAKLETARAGTSEHTKLRAELAGLYQPGAAPTRNSVLGRGARGTSS